MTKYTSKMDLTKEIKEEYQPGGSQRQYILDKAVEYIRDVPGIQQAKHYFCSQSCYNYFANKYVREVIAIAPRTEALETPIEVVKEQSTDWHGSPYISTRILTVDNVS